MKRPVLIAALPALLFAGAVAAQPTPAERIAPPPPGAPPGAGGRLFINPDGEPFRGPDGRGAWFARADADHDGAITPAEFRADALLFFRVLDANHDGVVDGAENQVYEREIAPEITRLSIDQSPPGGRGERGGSRRPGGQGGERAGGRKGPGGVGREGAARFGLLNEPQPVRGADANLDYRITADEWVRAAARRFALLDRSGDGIDDGRLTLATLPPAPDQGGPGGGEGPSDRRFGRGPRPPR
jgi:hypothetical protein